jgi:hypothetical protein
VYAQSGVSPPLQSSGEAYMNHVIGFDALWLDTGATHKLNGKTVPCGSAVTISLAP